MDKIERVYEWFSDYVCSFYTEDEFVMAGIKLKEKHSIKVARNALDLAVSLGLDGAGQQLAEVIGLCHDTGRFIQYSQYRTFNDAISIDHGTLGVEELRKAKILDCFTEQEQDIIYFALVNHNKLSIAQADDTMVFYARLIRDADKLDIFRTLPPIQAGHDYSLSLLDRLVTGKPLPYQEVKTVADKQLIRIGWLFDIYFSWTLQQLKTEGYIDRLLADLPGGEIFSLLKQKVHGYSINELK